MVKIMKGIGTAGSLVVGIVASVILIVMGLIYFVIALAIVKFGAGMLGYTELHANWAVLSASLISVGSMVGSALKK